MSGNVRQELQDDHTKTYWKIVDGRNTIGAQFESIGSIQKNTDGLNMECDLEGTGVTKEVLAFLAENTSVEWGMVYRSQSGGYGRLFNDHDSEQVEIPFYPEYNELYHTHPYRSDGNGGVSEEDYMASGELGGSGYTKAAVYDATSHTWITYWGND